MNNNALKGDSTIEIKETYCGPMHGVGFSKTDGYIMPREEYYEELRKNGYTIEFTKNGVIICSTK